VDPVRPGTAVNARDLPIGVFDSGVGGLTVLKELHRQLPGESTLYLGDEARMPYGPRPAAEVLTFTREALAWFAARDVKLLVIACNTASAVALEAVREETRMPIIGVVRPGAAAALSASSRRAIGVMATAGTVQSSAYVRALKDLDPFVEVHQQPCPRLVPMVEAGEFDTPMAADAIEEYIGWMVQGEPALVDTLLLGCTHYPLLRPAISKVVGPSIRVVDSATTTAYAVREVLASHGLLRQPPGAAHRIFTTSDTDQFRRVARTLFGEDLPAVEEVRLPLEPVVGN
jgi:glutamate racemase